MRKRAALAGSSLTPWRRSQFIALIPFLRLPWLCNIKLDGLKVTALRTAESAIKSSTGWVFLDSAETLFITAKERVFAAIEVMN